MTSDPETFMRRAVELSEQGMRNMAGGPFGAVIVRDGEIIAEGWNRVTSHNDPSAHAEIVAIREACAKLGTFSLAGSEIYASAEPCPMCLGAIYWARLDRLYYANTREEAAEIGFDDAFIYDEIAKPTSQRTIPTVRIASREALSVFRAWPQLVGKLDY